MLCYPSADEAPDKDPPRHHCGGVSAKGDEDPGVSSQNGIGKLMEDCVAGGEPDHIQSDECSDDDTVIELIDEQFAQLIATLHIEETILCKNNNIVPSKPATRQSVMSYSIIPTSSEQQMTAC